MHFVPSTETVTLTADLAEINRKSDQALIGYRLRVQDETGAFCPSITCWKTIGEDRSPNPAFELVESRKDKLTNGAVVHGLVCNMYYSKAQEGVEVMLASFGQVTERVHQE
jgi:hypothetical protein